MDKPAAVSEIEPRQRNTAPGRRLAGWLMRPVSAQSLAFFRIALGIVLALDAATYLWPRGATNWVEAYYTGPHVHWLFPYHGFAWVRPWPEPWMSLHFVAYGMAGLALAAGAWTRTSALLAGVLYGYVFLLDETHYNNHYYLTVLLCFLLAVMPTAAVWSVDRWRRVRRLRRSGAEVPPATIRFWPVALLRFQWFVVYLYAGLAKMSPGWLFHAQPLHSWLRDPAFDARLAPYFSPEQLSDLAKLYQSYAFAAALSYAGLLFDLAIGFLLLFRRTRLLGMALVIAFHALNHFLIFDDIAWFPLMAVLLTTIFLEPDWPARLVRWLRRPRVSAPDWGWLVAGMILVPGLGALLGWKLQPTADGANIRAPSRASRWLVPALGVYVALQLLLPLRHLLIAGDVNWTSEGERFAWRMKTGLKRTLPMEITVIDPALVASTSGRAQDVHWAAWRGPKVVYRDVSGPTVDFRRLPELFVELSPYYGERLVYNPWSGAFDEPRSLDDSVARVQTLWQQTYGRLPKFHKTFPLVEVLDAAAARIGVDRLSHAELVEFAQAREVAVAIARGQSDPEKWGNPIRYLNARLADLVADPAREVASTFRRALAEALPFAASGAPNPGGTFLVIEDPQLLRASPAGALVLLRREEWKLAWDQAHAVYADFANLPADCWQGLPLIIPRQSPTGELTFVWNARAELTPLQELICRGRPFMCHQYAQHVADQWQSQFGRRPAVHMNVFAALAPYRVQYAIDPRVDLVAAPLTFTRHNPWIMPLEATLSP